MTTRQVEVNIRLTAREIENEIWEMDSTNQAQLLSYMAHRLADEFPSVVLQMQAVKDDIDDLFTEVDKEQVKTLIEKLSEYFG